MRMSDFPDLEALGYIQLQNDRRDRKGENATLASTEMLYMRYQEQGEGRRI
jgi:hypothetical protein